MKKLLLALVLASLTSFAEQVNFNADWEFALRDFKMSFGKVGMCKPQNSSNDNGTPRVAADTNGWKRVTLPHDWALELPFGNLGARNGLKAIGSGYPSTSIGWYRKWFTLPVSRIGQRAFIEFDGVYRDWQVWLNGIYLGRCDSGYASRSFDITDLLNYGTTNNFVSVRVNASIDEGWWYDGAGICRNVHLRFAQPDGIVPNTTFIRLVALTNGVAHMRATYSKFISGPVQRDFTVANPRLWSPSDPYLYTLDLEGETFTYGIRTIEFSPTRGLLINGVRTPVNGVCCHQDHAGLGVAVPDSIVDFRIRRLKEMGVTAYRTSHNPPSPSLLDACDRHGILVFDETRFFSASPEGLDQFATMIKRDRNHPCVVAWSLGNEEHNVQNTSLGKRMALAMRRLQRELDPTRPCSYGGNNGMQFNGVNEVTDVRGVNYVRLMGTGKAKQMCCGTDDYHAAHPSQPMWGSEEASTLTTRGAEDKIGSRLVMPDIDTPATRPLSWALGAEEWTSFTSAREYFAGAFAWTGFDYRGECSWPATINNFGILDLCGFPKNNFYYYQARWTDRDVLHIYPHWNFPRTNLWVNTNCDEVELFINGKSVGRQTRAPGQYRLNFPVTYAPGTVTARALRNGRAVTNSIHTSSTAYSLKLTPLTTTLTADGQDTTLVNVTALDAAGHEVPTACDVIYIEETGTGAQIVGVGNGDPMSHEPDVCKPGEWTRRLFNGKAQIAIRATTNAAPYTLSAHLTPLVKSSLPLTITPPPTQP